jgi:hypothetical protein
VLGSSPSQLFNGDSNWCVRGERELSTAPE